MSVPSHWQLSRAAGWIRDGGIVAYPTEAVFGLGCNPHDPLATARLLALKNRPWQKGLILVAASLEQLQPWIQPLNNAQLRRLRNGWPGPLTWLLPASADCPTWLTGQHDSIAVRVSAHPVVQRLCRRVGGAIVSTSANKSGQRPARSVLEVRLRLGQGIDFVLPGALGGRQQPSRIRDLVSGRVIRP